MYSVCRERMGLISLYLVFSLNSLVLLFPLAQRDTCGTLFSISPCRTQFFSSETVTVYCEEQWRMKMNRNGETGKCDLQKSKESSCTIEGLYSSDSGVFWCESDSGGRSDAVNITVTDVEDGVILTSPVFPVVEGEPVTLRCWSRETRYKTVQIKANFYKDGLLVEANSTEMNIPAVNKSDEGRYKCVIPGRESPESWLTVRDGRPVLLPPTLPPHPPLPPPPPRSSSLLLHLVGTGVSILLMVLLVVGLLFWRKHKAPRAVEENAPEEVTYAVVMSKPMKKRGPDSTERSQTDGLTAGPGSAQQSQAGARHRGDAVNCAEENHVRKPQTNRVSAAADEEHPQDMTYENITPKPTKKRGQ